MWLIWNQLRRYAVLMQRFIFYSFKWHISYLVLFQLLILSTLFCTTWVIHRNRIIGKHQIKTIRHSKLSLFLMQVQIIGKYFCLLFTPWFWFLSWFSILSILIHRCFKIITIQMKKLQLNSLIWDFLILIMIIWNQKYTQSMMFNCIQFVWLIFHKI